MVDVNTYEANYWDDARKVWIDGKTGNYMRPVDAGGDGIWYSSDSKMAYVNGQWISNGRETGGGVSTPGVATASSGGASTGSANAYTVNPGYGMDIMDREQKQALDLANISEAGANARSTQSAEAQKAIAELQGRHSKELAQINNDAQASLQKSINDLQRELDEKKITSTQYMQEKDLAQREHEFARSLALQELTQRQTNELNTANLEINRAAETRQERALQANLAANPQDWVAYQFYKRQLPGAGVSASSGGAMLNGEEYASAPGAVSDASAQSLATNLFNPTQPGATYNPNLRGTGAFGTSIEAPNTFTRREAGASSEADLGMLQGLLRAGINVNGQQVAVDPQEWMSQAQKSWVPTLSEQGTVPTTYR